MNGANVRMSGASSATNGTAFAYDGLSKTAAAWECFTAGEDTVDGVRPEILTSWYRCREEYGVDPGLDRAPPAAPEEERTLDRARCGVHRARRPGYQRGSGGLRSRRAGHRDRPRWTHPGVLGKPASTRHGEDSNLAPWSTWSEWASGTNGMGTALECRHPVMVRGPEHWCRAFHAWVCAGVAVRDVVTHDPLAASASPAGGRHSPMRCCRGSAMRPPTEAKLRQRARHTGVLLALHSPMPGWRPRRRSPQWTRPETSYWLTQRPLLAGHSGGRARLRVDPPLDSPAPYAAAAGPPRRGACPPGLPMGGIHADLRAVSWQPPSRFPSAPSRPELR
jgi:hypothetical protein